MLPLTTVVDVLTEYPAVAVALAIALRLARAYQTQLTWPEYRTAHRFKRGLFPLVARLPTVGTALPWVSDKGGRDDAEYLRTIDGSVRGVVTDLQAAGASLHLLNSLKRRPDTHGDPFTAAHVVWTVAGTTEQVEGYLFRNDDGTVDLYAHGETSVDDPLGHLTDPQTDGDAHGVVPEKESSA
jgi:hypothetical protein